MATNHSKPSDSLNCQLSSSSGVSSPSSDIERLPAGEMSTCSSPANDDSAMPHHISAFPTVNEPVSHTTLKDMLRLLRAPLHADM